jgi:hypothetical protein
MPDCTCATDWRAIPKERRIVVSMPGAEVRRGAELIRDASKIFTFDRDCLLHGYKEVTDD